MGTCRASERFVLDGRPLVLSGRPAVVRRALAAHRISEVERTVALHHDGVFEQQVSTRQLREIRDAVAEQHRREADTDFVHEAEIESLLDDVGAGDDDVLISGDLPGSGYGW